MSFPVKSVVGRSLVFLGTSKEKYCFYLNVTKSQEQCAAPANRQWLCGQSQMQLVPLHHRPPLSAKSMGNT